MSATLAPASVSELVEVVRSCPRLLATGAGTKPRLSKVDVTKVSTTKLRGIVEYEPSEFTFTAMAGTPLQELAGPLAARGQYLPFDPFLIDAGATLGGTVAAGLSGPGRARFGGLRDFILGVRFVDGLGRLLRMGGKVVKNAAGFDLPKFFVGSLGRFGLLVDLTFKVFPAPRSTLTLRLQAANMEIAARILCEAGSSRWELDALEILPGTCHVCLRLAGPSPAVCEIADHILTRWAGEKLSEADAQKLWTQLREFHWVHRDGPLIKVAMTPALVPALHRELQSLDAPRIHFSGGGNLALISLPMSRSRDDSPESKDADSGEQRVHQKKAPQQFGNSDFRTLNEALLRLGLSAVTLRGEAPLWCGVQRRANIAQAVKQALDPQNRFPGLDE